MSVPYFVSQSLLSILRSLGNERSPPLSAFYSRTSLPQLQVEMITTQKLPAEMFSNAMDLLAEKGNVVCQPCCGNNEKKYFVNASQTLVQNDPENKITNARIKKFTSESPLRDIDKLSFNDIAKVYLGLHMVVCKPDNTVKAGHVYVCHGCLMFQVCIIFITMFTARSLYLHYIKLTIIVYRPMATSVVTCLLSYT